MKTPRQLSDIMTGDATLSMLLRQVQTLQVLEALLNARTGDSFAQHCKVAALKEDGVLVLVARTPVWATRLRYLAPDLVEWAKGVPELSTVKSIQVQVARQTGP